MYGLFQEWEINDNTYENCIKVALNTEKQNQQEIKIKIDIWLWIWI